MNEQQIRQWWEEQLRKLDLESLLLWWGMELFGLPTSTAMVVRKSDAMVMWRKTP